MHNYLFSEFLVSTAVGLGFSVAIAVAVKSIFQERLKAVSLARLLIPIFVVCGILYLFFALSPKQVDGGNGTLIVDPADRVCQTDDDCAIVSTRCSNCECGVPVNKEYMGKYENAWRQLCHDYHGGVCEYNCPTPYARCVERQCLLSEK